jgi:integrase
MEIIYATTPFIIDRNFKYLDFPNKYIQLMAFKSTATLRNYTHCLFHWLKWCEDNRVAWESATVRDVLAYLESQAVSNTTRNYRMRRLKDFYDTAKAYGYASPLDLLMAHRNLIVRRTHRKEIRIPAIGEVMAFIQKLPTERDRLIAEVMLFCGLRRAEVLRLPRSILRGTIARGVLTFSVVGKGDKQRTAQMSADLCERLLKLPSNGAYIFTNHGSPLHLGSLNKIFRTVSKESGIAVNPHLLRHTFATFRLTSLLRDLGKDGVGQALKQLQREMGHEQPQTTLLYLHLVNDPALTCSYPDFVKWMQGGAK